MMVHVAQSVGVGPVKACSWAAAAKELVMLMIAPNIRWCFIIGSVMYQSSCQRLRMPSMAPAS